MRFTVISLGIIAAVMISSVHAVGGDASDITEKVKRGADGVVNAADVNYSAQSATGAGDTVSGARNAAFVARRSFLARRSLGRAAYKRSSISYRDSRVTKRLSENEPNENEPDENEADEDEVDEDEVDEDKSNKPKSPIARRRTLRI
ncbi:hypothetical protein MFLAVUS_003934 [Mucor flavus]|uniref:RxLR effector protein n=1 Tax=Mucor flavus TaxID=439312 RepID=A0ABP9YUI5_9FUNG